MSSRTADRDELGAFLKARRAELSPSDVGLPEGGTHRRVAGLRREEVAQLAAISTDYYTARTRPDQRVCACARSARARPASHRRPAHLHVRARRQKRRHEAPPPCTPERQAAHATHPRPYRRHTGDRDDADPRHPRLEPIGRCADDRLRRGARARTELPSADLHRPADARPLSRLGRTRARGDFLHPHGGGAQTRRPPPRRVDRRPIHPRSTVPSVVGRTPRRLQAPWRENVQPPRSLARSHSTGTHSPPTQTPTSSSSSTHRSPVRPPSRHSASSPPGPRANQPKGRRETSRRPLSQRR
jgi:hypothetical protein